MTKSSAHNGAAAANSEAARAELESNPFRSQVMRLVREMASAWARGECPRAEDYLARYPDLCGNPEAAVRLIYEEVCLREDLGQRVSPQEVVSRFPQWQAELEVLLDCHQLLNAAEEPSFPEVGETLGGFRLLAVLGSGAEGRVYLGSQSPLADRPVVLKVTQREGQEHLALARLQHTHIVPLYTAEDYLSENLRLLCMPYLGGAVLSQLLDGLQGLSPGQRTGLDLVRALDQAQASVPVVVPATGPARQFLALASYPHAVCWIGACLADALHYAHERGLVHLDLKPSNVLITNDGQPMLLDFHLARASLLANDAPPPCLGGTPGYMSPEQRAAMAAVRWRRPVPAAVDARSDVYSLGLVLYETLGGDALAAGSGAPPNLCARNPQVSPGLADILGKCLAPQACDRYATAGALAADLRRYLSDLPLKGVSNRNWRERWHKWRRRKPHALGLAGLMLAMVLTLLAAGGVLLQQNDQRLRHAEAALAAGRAEMQSGHGAQAVQTLMRGLDLARGAPGGGELTRLLECDLRRARRALAAQQLHAAADRMRFLLDADSLAHRELQALETQCGKIWQARELILDNSQTALEPEMEQRLRTDLLDLAILWADLRVRLTEGDHQTRRDALQVLAEAETLFGPSQALFRERQAHAQALELPEVAQAAAFDMSTIAPKTAWDHYALGRFLLRTGQLDAAAAALQQAVDLQPSSFWPHFYAGLCACRMQQHAQAIAAFTACLTIAPDSAPCYHNRALAEAALGRLDRALSDCSRALDHEPRLAAAALNRGVLHYRQQRYAEAIADLERALACGADPGTIHYNLALAYLGQQDRRAALTCAERALQHNPGHQSARELLTRLQR